MSTGFIVFLIIVLIIFLKAPSKILLLLLLLASRHLIKKSDVVNGGGVFAIEPLKIHDREKKFYKALSDNLIKKGWSSNKESKPRKLIYKDDYRWRPFVDTKIVLNKFGIKKSLAFMNKQKLYETVPKKIRDLYFMKQVLIDRSNLHKYKKIFDSKWILKPKLGYGGIGITVVDDYNTFEKFISSTSEQYIMARYIDNPLLIDGKNSVTRFFITLLREKNKLRVFLLPYGILRLAKKKYKMSDVYDSDRDNLHLKNTDTKIFTKFVDKKLGVKKRSYLLDQVKKFIRSMKKVFTLECYDNNEKCYELLAVDIIITDDLKIKVLEINSRPGFFDLPMSNILADWIYDMSENTKKYTSSYEEIK